MSRSEIVRRLSALDVPTHGALIDVIDAMQSMAVGEELEMLTDDPAAMTDIPRWASEAGHQVETQAREGKVCLFVLRKRV